jgi:hypothetical protein
MKVGVITLMTALLFALPALAGTGPDCGLLDTDSDGTFDWCDNCSATANAAQTDGDSDGYGNLCDADLNNNGQVDGGDFVMLGLYWGQAVPPIGAAPLAVDINDNGQVDGGDFVILGATWGGFPGPACGNPPGTPCPHVP